MKRIAVAAAAIAVFAVLCWDAGRRVGDAYPSVRRCLANPAKFAGREIWIIPGKIINPDPEGFTLVHGTGNIRIRSTMYPPADEYAFVRGLFQEDGTIVATGVDVVPDFLLKRKGIIAVSLITLFFFAILGVRTFVWRAGALQVRQHHSAEAPQELIDRDGNGAKAN